MVIGQSVATTEILIVGAGPGGYVAAIRAAQLGYSVILLDKAGELGGLCLHHGCIPTKSLIHVAHLYYEARNAKKLGINLEGNLDFPTMQKWKQDVVDKLAAGINGLCKKHKIRVAKGTARFTSPTQVIVQGEGLDFNAVEFRHCIIATGSRPRKYPGVEFGGRILSSREAIALNHCPKTMCVIGGGYIGIEIGVLYRKAGAEVTIVESTQSILGVVEPEISKVAYSKLQDLGINVILGAKVENPWSNEEKAGVKINGEDREYEYILVAIGHEPYTENLGLENAGVTLDEKGFIKIDNQCRTTTKHIYAVGDVTGGMMLAHKASAQGKVAAEAIAGKPTVFEPACIPAVIFSDPEIGTVGLREQEAKAKYGEGIKIGMFPFSALGKAHSINSTKGFVKIIAAPDGTVIGVHAVGPGVTDCISEAALAIEMGATAEDVALTIHPHPTLGESMSEAAEVLLGQSIHLYQPK